MRNTLVRMQDQGSVEEIGMNSNRNAGFTIVEMVVVMVIVGILASVALPRFVSLQDDAYSASVESTGGAFASAVNLVHSAWLVAGGTAAVDQVTLEGGQTVGVTDAGWPENNTTGNNTVTAAECAEAWNAILTPGSPQASAAAGSDYISTYADPVCTFTLNAIAGRTVAYDHDSGSVTITVP